MNDLLLPVFSGIIVAAVGVFIFDYYTVKTIEKLTKVIDHINSKTNLLYKQLSVYKNDVSELLMNIKDLESKLLKNTDSINTLINNIKLEESYFNDKIIDLESDINECINIVNKYKSKKAKK